MRVRTLDPRADRVPRLTPLAVCRAGAAAAAATAATAHEHDRRGKQYTPPREHSKQLRGASGSQNWNRHAHKLRAAVHGKGTLTCRVRRLVAELEQTCNRRRGNEQVTVSFDSLAARDRLGAVAASRDLWKKP